MNEEEEKQLMTAYMKAYMDGKCKNKSDFIRQAVLAYSVNGTKPPKDVIKKGEQVGEQDSISKLAQDFADLDF